MFPFVTGPERPAPRAGPPRGDARGAAPRRHRRSPPDVPIGLMLEVPSAAVTADLLAPHVQFFARGHQRPHPVPAGRGPRRSARLRPLRAAASGRAAHDRRRGARRRRAQGVPVSICGEMAADPLQALLLRRARRARALHEPGRHPGGQGGACARPPSPSLEPVARSEPAPWPPRRRSGLCFDGSWRRPLTAPASS